MKYYQDAFNFIFAGHTPAVKKDTGSSLAWWEGSSHKQDFEQIKAFLVTSAVLSVETDPLTSTRILVSTVNLMLMTVPSSNHNGHYGMKQKCKPHAENQFVLKMIGENQ